MHIKYISSGVPDAIPFLSSDGTSVQANYIIRIDETDELDKTVMLRNIAWLVDVKEPEFSNHTVFVG